MRVRIPCAVNADLDTTSRSPIIIITLVEVSSLSR
jgi:hypothetical protein